MSAKHTPGPWKAGRSDMATDVDGVDSKWIYAGDQYVAVASGRIEGNWDEVMANAHLIAAAPNLLKAAHAGAHLCRSLLAIRDGVTDELLTEIRDALDAAIADAEQP